MATLRLPKCMLSGVVKFKALTGFAYMSMAEYLCFSNAYYDCQLGSLSNYK